MFKLSQRSLKMLDGVNPKLVDVVKTAITITRVDFGVIEGVRTISRHRELYRSGASQTMNSSHLADESGFGNAVDLAAFIGPRLSWELNLYDDIADAMKQAAIQHNVKIRWGGAWNINDIRDWSGTMQEAMNHYIDWKRSRNERPFIDGPHFELRK